MIKPGWRWPLNRSPIIPEYQFRKYKFLVDLLNSKLIFLWIFAANGSGPSNQKLFDKDSYYCDRNLMQSLVYDAKITEWFSKNSTVPNPNAEKG